MPPGGSENLSRKKIIQEASTVNPMGLKNTQPTCSFNVAQSVGTYQASEN